MNYSDSDLCFTQHVIILLDLHWRLSASCLHPICLKPCLADLYSRLSVCLYFFHPSVLSTLNKTHINGSRCGKSESPFSHSYWPWPVNQMILRSLGGGVLDLNARGNFLHGSRTKLAQPPWQAPHHLLKLIFRPILA